MKRLFFALAPFFSLAKRRKPRSSLFASRKRLLRRLVSWESQCFPRRIEVKGNIKIRGKQNSLFPKGPVIKHGAILYKKAEVFSLSITNPTGRPILPFDWLMHSGLIFYERVACCHKILESDDCYFLFYFTSTQCLLNRTVYKENWDF